MSTVLMILMVLACACILLQALQINVKRIEIGWLGLFFWCLAITIPLLVHVGQLALVALVLVVFFLVVLIIVVNRRP
jgi:hypothetical protein